MAGIFSSGLHCAGRKSFKACSASSSLCLFVEISGEASNVVVPLHEPHSIMYGKHRSLLLLLRANFLHQVVAIIRLTQFLK